MNKLKSFRILLGEAWAIYMRRFGVLIAIVAPPYLLFSLMLGINSLFGFIVFLIALFLAALSTLALTYAIKDKLGFQESYKLAWTGIWSYGWLIFLMGLISVGGVFMGIIPAIIFSVWFYLVPFVFVSEGDRGFNALLKSREYARNHWWPLWWKMLLITALFSIINFILGISNGTFEAIKMAMEGSFTQPTPNIISELIKNIVTILSVPFAVAYGFVIYKNFTELKPDLAQKKITEPKGFLIFSAIWGLIAPVVLFIVAAIVLYTSFYNNPAVPPAIDNQLSHILEF